MRAEARLLVFAGGVLGTLARAAAGTTAPGTFPWRTLAVNLAGTALLGLLVGRFEAGRASTRLLHFAGVGVMGSLTTFGAMAVQILDLVGSGHPGSAVAYTIVSLAGGAAVGLVSLRLGEEWT